MRAEGTSEHAIQAAYAHCRGVALRSRSSFAAAFWLFPRRQRKAVYAIYAFCRLADDIADDPGVRGDRARLLARWRAELALACEGRAAHPVGVALGDALRRFALPRELFEELLQGIATDLERRPLESFEDVYRYCTRVASTVGMLMVRLLGLASPRALAYAEAMGVAVQLVNILRDVGEDAASGRVYLAREDLRRFGVREADLRAEPTPDAVRLLLACYAERARIHFERAARLRPEAERARLRPAEAMGRIYRGLLDELQRRRFPHATPALRLSGPRRLALAASVYVGGASA